MWGIIFEIENAFLKIWMKTGSSNYEPEKLIIVKLNMLRDVHINKEDKYKKSDIGKVINMIFENSN